MSAATPNTAASWAHCVSAFLRPFAADLSDELCVVLGSGLWLGLEQRTGFDERLPARAAARALRPDNPMAMEHLSEVLHYPLMTYRRAHGSQTYWLVRRALSSKKTIIKLSDRVFHPAEGAPESPVYALVSGVSGTDALPARSPEEWRDEAVAIDLDFGGGTTLRLPSSELARHWLRAYDKDFSTEFYAFLPAHNHDRDDDKARPSPVEEQWRLALARQYYLLHSTGLAAVRGVSTLAFLRDELRAAGGASRSCARQQAALLARATTSSGDMSRGLFAAGLAQLRTRGARGLEEPIGRYLEAAESWTSCSIQVAEPAACTRADLLGVYDAIEAKERAALESLREPLAGWI